MQNYLEPLMTNGRFMMLAYDQGMEHGPHDFNDQNSDPKFILDIARSAGFSAMALQYGLALHFWKGSYEDIPLVVKMNGKTSLGKEQYSTANCTVEDVVNLGAKAVGYTLYIGSDHEAEMIREFSQIRDLAHAASLGVIIWVYPSLTPPNLNDDEREADIVAYAARTAAELGADAVKLKYPNQKDKLPWIVKNAPGVKVLMSGGDKEPDTEFLSKVKLFLDAGGNGVAVGRNIWQNENPLELSRKLKELVFAV